MHVVVYRFYIEFDEKFIFEIKIIDLAYQNMNRRFRSKLQKLSKTELLAIKRPNEKKEKLRVFFRVVQFLIRSYLQIIVNANEKFQFGPQIIANDAHL